MRILSTTMCYPTAGHPEQGVFVQRRCLALAQIPGVSVRVVSPQPWCPILRPPAIDQGVGPLPARYPRMLSVPILGWATDGVAFARALQGQIAREVNADRRPDVIDAHFEYPDAVGACLAGQRFGIPVVVTIRGKIVSLSRKTLRRMQIAWMLRRATGRIAVSHSLAEWARRVGGSDLTVHVIPNGIDGAVFHSISRIHARQSLRWDPSRRYVLAVGHQQKLKGFDRVLSAVHDVHAGTSDVRFVLVGSTRGEPSFRRLLARLAEDLNRNCTPSDPLVQLLPPVPAHVLNMMYNAADVLVNASRSEGWCNAISEALACGTPVIATDVGGNREQLMQPSESPPLNKGGQGGVGREVALHSAVGRIVPDDDIPALATAITEVLRSSWDREAISRAGSARSWDDAARQVLEVLREAATQRAKCGLPDQSVNHHDSELVTHHSSRDVCHPVLSPAQVAR